MPISFQPSHKAQLNVEIGKTSLEELQKFSDQVAEKGGGEIRARKNKDGTVTLYAPANSKIRLSSLSSKWGETARTAKKDLAVNVMKEIISRRMPGGDDRGLASGILRNVGNRSGSLATALKETGLAAFESVPDSFKQKFQTVDGIMSQPETREAFRQHLEGQHTGENFTFLRGLQDFQKAGSPQEKMALAEKLFKMIESEENPPSVFDQNNIHKDVQINISGASARSTFDQIRELRQSLVPGQEPSPQDRAKLDHLFDNAKQDILLMLQPTIGQFTVKPEFKAALGHAYARTSQQGLETSSAGRLAPGSGAQFQDGVRTLKDHFKTIDTVLGDPEVATSFREHLTQTGKLEHLNHYQALQDLGSLSQEMGVPDTELLKALGQAMGIPWEAPEIPLPSVKIEGEIESLDLDPQPPKEDGVPEQITKEFRKLQSELNDMNELFGEGGSQGEGGNEVLIRSKIKDFINTLQKDAANGLRAGNLQGFVGSDRLYGLLERRVSDRLFNQQLEWQPGSEQHFGSFDRFAGRPLEGSGGATGSGRTRIGGQFYQVKGSIEHAGLGRRLKAGGLNTENYGEVIASNIARALVGTGSRSQMPEVSLRQDVSKHEAVVTSRYLNGGKGDLKALYMERAGPLPRGQKHPKIHLDSVAPSGGGVLRLDTTASRDVQRNIALSALLGDHDVNPGNMIALKDGHVGRIDFGHAFNELITGIGGRATGGGGVHNRNNRILDFYNRETVSGVPLTGQTRAKLWRDYVGAGPSEGTTQALRTIADSTEWMDGLAQAKTQFLDLVVSLSKEGTEEAQAQIRDLTDSLKRMSQNIDKPVTATAPSDVIRQVFDNLNAFVTEGQTQMRTVADLSDLQTQIDEHIRTGNPDVIPQSILQGYERLKNSSVGAPEGGGLTWMKLSADTPAFTGTLVSYMTQRRAELEQVG